MAAATAGGPACHVRTLHTYSRLESLQGKRLAIDSSIWLYHFQMAMRDRDGKILNNAHLLGFLWRILKLLFYGIRPVFVFDGGAPVQKRRTLLQRKQRKTMATDTLARTAEKLLAAQLRQAALQHHNETSRPSDSLEEGTVYYDEVGRSNAPPTSGRMAPLTSKTVQSVVKAVTKDPYQLPAMPKEALQLSERKDLRFATESELRALMNSIAPEDLDMNSELFRSLPPELQYELVGDLRAKSRGTSYKRLQDMLASAPTPIDFSRAQVAGLKTRNDLTQKVLTVTDEIGSANIQVPLRVAGSRNREYVLTHIEGGDGGFALGAPEAGTSRDKAIVVDDEDCKPDLQDEEDWDPLEMEEVEIPSAPPASDPELDALVHSDLDPVQRKERALAFLSVRAEQHRRQKRQEAGMDAWEERVLGHVPVVPPSRALFREPAEEEAEAEEAVAHAPRRSPTPLPLLSRPSDSMALLPPAPSSGLASPSKDTLHLTPPRKRATSPPSQEWVSTPTKDMLGTSKAMSSPPETIRSLSPEPTCPPKQTDLSSIDTPATPDAVSVSSPTTPSHAGQAPTVDQPAIPATPREKDASVSASPASSPWAWSPSPEPERVGPDGFPLPSLQETQAIEAEEEQEWAQWDQDQSQFASFLSTASGRSLPDMQREVAAEVAALRQEHARLRSSEDEITSQMTSEIQTMLRMFGLPYITAPMEAEAQCAQLAMQQLVDGIITDDSDVFLFGGTPVYRNMFNSRRTVECYRLSDMERELGLDRDRLIQLAFLLGSDYTEGLTGVGPVLAMEILSLFPPKHALEDFRAWWKDVQVGADSEQAQSSVRRRIKRALRNKVHLSDSWPDPKERDAYVHPTVDESDEPFVWGQADLDAVRSFLGEYLHWSTSKTDQYVLPVIEQQRKTTRLHRVQATLDQAGFVGGHVPEPMSARRFESTRLQQVVQSFRERQRAEEASALPAASSVPMRKRKPRQDEEAYVPRPTRSRRDAGRVSSLNPRSLEDL